MAIETHVDMDYLQVCLAVPDGLIVIDLEFNVRFINSAFIRMSGVTPNETIGYKCYEIFHGPLCGGPSCPMMRIKTGAEHLEYEGEQSCCCRIRIPIFITAIPYRDINGHLIGIVQNITDISSVKGAEKALARSEARFRKAMGAIIQAMSLTIEKRDPYTAGHQRRVTKLCRVIANELGFSWERTQGLRMAAAIHDLGKIMVPAAILNRPGAMTEHELAIIQLHPQAAYDILKDIDFPWPIAETVYQHHERLDGSGYPRGLKGDQIILEARILAVADTAEAISSFRPYRPSLGIDRALTELQAHRGTRYDETIVDVCVQALTKGKVDWAKPEQPA